MVRARAFSWILIAGLGGACGGTSDQGGDAIPQGTGGASNIGNGGGWVANGGAGNAGDSGGAGGSCSADFAGATLQPVYLAFAFDISGSMGELDYPWYDPELKWKPVVGAVEAFFADTGSEGIQASLTFFPAEEDKCSASIYALPVVPMTPLPSNVFQDAIIAVTPQTSSDWRGGTPTLAVTQGTLGFVEKLSPESPSAKYAYVLVTDGYPEGCSDQNDIDLVANAVAAVADTIPTYVIGVSNPAPGPDTVSNLNAVAVAGGTGQAFIIQTGDPAQTATDFEAAIDSIRGKSVSCSADIPANPGGQPFDKTKVNVEFMKDGMTTKLAYDPSCAQADAWRYDDANNPTSIILCSGACAEAQQAGAELTVEFGCATQVAIPK